MREVSLREWSEQISDRSVFDYDRYTVTRGYLHWLNENVYVVTNINKIQSPTLLRRVERVAAVLGNNSPDKIIGLVYDDELKSRYQETDLSAASSSALTVSNGAVNEASAASAS